MTISQARALLLQTNRVLAHQREREMLRGERFNIFSILGLETAENQTHSAFISELLNPAGSHLKGSLFLQLFIDAVGIPDFELTDVYITVEEFLGYRDDTTGTGGRADIYIRNGTGRSITIENKIYAADQPAQILRYCNHNSAGNRVYYLTLTGTEPAEASRGNLESGKDFFLLSYQTDIIPWLRRCHKETVDQPILRETLRQYILILQKLTGTMDTAASRELDDLLFEFFEEADAIARNLEASKNRLTESIRQAVISLLADRLGREYVVEGGNDSSKQYSQIWIWLHAYPDAELYYGMESFSGRGGFDGLFIGVFNPSGKRLTFDRLKESTPRNAWWANIRKIPALEGFDAHMANPRTLRKLYQDEAFPTRFIDHLVSAAMMYLDHQRPGLETFLKS